MNHKHCLELLSEHYPQLLLPIKEGMKSSDAYRSAVLRGEQPEGSLLFSLSEQDTFVSCSTPAGEIDVLTLWERADFEHAIQAFSHKCEPVPVPPSQGAVFLKGLIDWKKIHDHQTAYIKEGGTDWPSEFQKFTSVPANYRNSLIILSSGSYSNIAPDEIPLPEMNWRQHSLTIRKYHELTHFICRSLYPDNIDVLRDEIIADMMGLLAAFGTYDTRLACLFLGIEKGSCQPGGRLENYVTREELPAKVSEASQLILSLAKELPEFLPQNLFDLLSPDYLICFR